MKILIITLLTILSFSPIQAQYETTMFLYDTISEGPFIAPEKSGYNFIFKTQNVGTMVSTRGQVINPAIPYDVFNHYHIQSDGTVDSIFAITVRSEVNHHYTMYKRGAPKLLQFRIGTSNDYSIETIASKYPILNSPFINDELLTFSKIDISENEYSFTNQSFNQGIVKETVHKANIDISTEEGRWAKKGELKLPNAASPISIVAFGKVIEDDKERKFNDLKEFKFLSLNKEGKVLFDEEIVFDRAYNVHRSGIIHHADANIAGYFISMLEASGKANKDYNAAVQKVLLFDAGGQYLTETNLTLPFEPKSKGIGKHEIVKVLKNGNDHKVILYTPGNKKAKVEEGFYTYLVSDHTAEQIAYHSISSISIEQNLRNQLSEKTTIPKNYAYAQQLEKGDLLLVSSENGTAIQFLQLDPTSKIKYSSTSFLLNNVEDAQALLTFEQLDFNRLLIISKIGSGKSVRTSYSIYNGTNGQLRTIQPQEDIQSIFSYRNGNEILVFGSSQEDINRLHFKLEKLQKKDEGVTSIGRE